MTTSMISADNHSAPDSRSNFRFLLLLSLAIVLAGALLYGTNNRFHFRCHADEPAKVRQIQTETRNFHHPLLMLNSVQAAFAISGAKTNPQNVVWVGRLSSALFTTVAVMALAWTAFLLSGRVGAVLCSAFLLCTPMLLELSHYFKEDAALIMGVALTFLAITLYQRLASVPNLLLLAICAALTASSKHIGAFVLPFCIYTVATANGSKPKRILLFLLVTLGVYALINYQVFLHPSGFFNGISRESYYLKNGGSKVGGPRSGFFSFNKYMGVIRGNTPLVFLWFVGFGFHSWWKGRSERTSLGQILLFAGSTFLLLSLIPKASGRYFLPVTALLCLTAAIGAARIFAKTGWKWKVLGFAIPLTLALLAQGRWTYRVYQDFHHDTRTAMAEWITKNLPANAVIAQEPTALLSSASDSASDNPNKIPQKLIDAGSICKPDFLNSLRHRGASYLICELSERDIPKSSPKDTRAIEESVLKSIKAKCKPLWMADATRPRITNVRPDLAVYQLPEDSEAVLPDKAPGDANP
ncbi:MAG: phospholipid carrier-dependent glycosyltransferase [Verrucomicrobiota bacterium]